MTTSRDLFYFTGKSSDGKNNGGKWTHNGDFVIDLQNNQRFLKGVIGVKMDSVSIPNTVPNIRDSNCTFRFMPLARQGPDPTGQLYYEPTAYSTTLPPTVQGSPGQFEVEVATRVSGSSQFIKSFRVSVNIPAANLAATQSLSGWINAIDLAMFNTPVPEIVPGRTTLTQYVGITTPFITKSNAAVPLMEFVSRPIPNSSQTILFRFPTPNTFVWEGFGFEPSAALTTFEGVKRATEPVLAVEIKADVGQYGGDEAGDQPLLDNLNVKLGSITGTITGTPTYTFSQPGIGNTPQNRSINLRVSGAGMGSTTDEHPFYIYGTIHGSPLSSKIGFNTSGRGFLADDPTTGITAPKVSELSGTRMFYLESDLAGGVVSVDGRGQSTSTLCTVPVDVPYEAMQTRRWDNDSYHIIYAEPKAFSQIGFLLKDEEGEVIDPGAEEVYVSCLILPWHQC
jgi:hypothetical protein